MKICFVKSSDDSWEEVREVNSLEELVNICYEFESDLYFGPCHPDDLGHGDDVTTLVTIMD